jgi:hypothetical protein
MCLTSKKTKTKTKTKEQNKTKQNQRAKQKQNSFSYGTSSQNEEGFLFFIVCMSHRLKNLNSLVTQYRRCAAR